MPLGPWSFGMPGRPKALPGYDPHRRAILNAKRLQLGGTQDEHRIRILAPEGLRRRETDQPLGSLREADQFSPQLGQRALIPHPDPERTA